MTKNELIDEIQDLVETDMRFMLSNIHKRRVLYSEIISLCCDEAVDAVNKAAIPYLYDDGTPTGMGADLDYRDTIQAIKKRLKGGV